MKKLLASILAVSVALSGVNMTSYATEDTPTVSVEAQKSNPYMSEIDKELKDFFTKYNAETNSSEKQKLLDEAINNTQSMIDSHAHSLNVVTDSAQRVDIENKFAALKLKHSILSTVKTKEREKQSAVAQKEREKQSELDEKDRKLWAKDRELQVALDKQEKENKLEIKKLKQKQNDDNFYSFVAGLLLGTMSAFISFIFVEHFDSIYGGVCIA